MDDPFPRSLDILILSNGPGELATWVRPVVRALRQRWGNDRDRLRISLVLSPCPNSSGQEAAIAQRYDEIDRIQAAADFWPFLLRGKTAAAWDWRDQGVVIFLGGDQFFPVVVGRRLGYKTVTYAEWEARWLGQIDGFGLRRPETLEQVPAKHRAKCAVVGDLMVEAAQERRDLSAMPRIGEVELGGVETGGVEAEGGETEWVGLLAGSKAAKLTQGIPFVVTLADYWHQHRRTVRCFIPVAPTQTPRTLLRYAQAEHNPFVTTLGSPAIALTGNAETGFYFETERGARIELYTEFPAYRRLSQCHICITTVGANTAELGALAVPMVVLLPTQQLDAMRAWNGIPGLLANLPGVGSTFAKLINWVMLRKLGLLAWPNLWAGEEIVPELVGQLEPVAVAQQVMDYLEHPERLEEMRSRLRAVSGEPGAAQRLVDQVAAVLAGA